MVLANDFQSILQGKKKKVDKKVQELLSMRARLLELREKQARLNKTF